MLVGSFVRMLVASGVPLLVSTVVSVILVTGIRHIVSCMLCVGWCIVLWVRVCTMVGCR